MKQHSLIGMLALAIICSGGLSTFAALIGGESVQTDAADVVSVGVMCGWVTQAGTDFQTNETTPVTSSQSNFTELLAWCQNVDLFGPSNAMVLACRYSLEEKNTTLKSLPLKKSHRPALPTSTKAIPFGICLCGIAGLAVSRMRRASKHLPTAPGIS